MALQHAQSIPVPPSQKTELPIPPELDAIVLACLAKEPAGRPASARVLSEQLGAVPVPAWTPARARAWWTMHGR
jgi:serine/threonine-protein kinase